MRRELETRVSITFEICEIDAVQHNRPWEQQARLMAIIVRRGNDIAGAIHHSRQISQ
jgi:hypothetical protein